MRTWHHGHQLRGALYVLPHDATARLGAIRARLLVDLAALAPATAPPLEALRALGDPSPQGWCVALQVALGRARTPLPRPPQRPAAAPEGGSPSSWGEAVTALANDPDAAAPSLESVLAHGGELHVMLGADRSHPAGRPAAPLRQRPAVGVARGPARDLERGGGARRDAARGALPRHPAGARGLGRADAAGDARRAARRAAQRPRRDRAGAGRVGARLGPSGALPALGLAGTFAPLLAAADRLAGSGAGVPLAAPPVPGAWLEQVGPGGVVVAAGRVLERPPGRGRRSRRGAHRRDAGVLMEIAGERRDVPLAELRVPRHAPLFP